MYEAASSLYLRVSAETRILDVYQRSVPTDAVVEACFML